MVLFSSDFCVTLTNITVSLKKPKKEKNTQDTIKRLYDDADKDNTVIAAMVFDRGLLLFHTDFYFFFPL